MPLPKPKTELHVISFDPGGVLGWSHFVVDVQAFANPHEKVLTNLLAWRYGEFEGTEHEKVRAALDLIRTSRYKRRTNLVTGHYEIVTEDFELTQLIGGKDLLMPTRLNAILEYQLATLFRLELNYQHRSMRTGVTKERAKLWGIWPVKGKDAWASIQHGLTFLKRVKIKADELTWPKFQQQRETAYQSLSMTHS